MLRSGWNDNGNDLPRALSEIGIAIFRVTSEGAVVDLNPAAKSLVGRFFSTIGGKLRPAASNKSENFEQFVRGRQRHHRPCRMVGHIVLRSTDGELIVCSRLEQAWVHEARVQGAEAFRSSGQSDVLILAKVVVPSAGDLTRILTQDLGLSPAESRLVVSLHRYCDLGEAAVFLGLSKETVRSQIRAVFAKLGLRKQSEVIRLIEQIRSLSLLGQVAP